MTALLLASNGAVVTLGWCSAELGLGDTEETPPGRSSPSQAGGAPSVVNRRLVAPTALPFWARWTDAERRHR